MFVFVLVGFWGWLGNGMGTEALVVSRDRYYIDIRIGSCCRNYHG